MDAVEYLKIKKRILKSDKEESCNISCNICPFYMQESTTGISCKSFEVTYPEKAVSIVEKWAAEHPVKTWQSEFLKMFPNAAINADGVIYICPAYTRGNTCCDNVVQGCSQCRANYWLAEVEDDNA